MNSYGLGLGRYLVTLACDLLTKRHSANAKTNLEDRCVFFSPAAHVRDNDDVSIRQYSA